MTPPGRSVADETYEFDGDYDGGWSWRTVFDPSGSGTIRMRMENVIPAEHATARAPARPYPVMVLKAAAPDH
ncbi:hypothetical protein ACIBCR_04770 [Micromonospora echinospora]|uniref:hypothetical protein n=1 Tax=Micromonospora echinospora TaxID=1877 RepID=UPI00379C05E2